MVEKMVDHILRDDIGIREAVGRLTEGHRLDALAKKVAEKRGISVGRAKHLITHRNAGKQGETQ